MVTQPIDDNTREIQVLEPQSTEIVDGSGASATMTAVVTVTSVMRVVSASNLNLAFGATPTATTSTVLLPAGTVEYFKLTIGKKIAVLGGIANISTMG